MTHDIWCLMQQYLAVPLFSCLRQRKFKSVTLCLGETGGRENRRWVWEICKYLIFCESELEGKCKSFFTHRWYCSPLPSPKQRINLSILRYWTRHCCLLHEIGVYCCCAWNLETYKLLLQCSFSFFLHTIRVTYPPHSCLFLEHFHCIFKGLADLSFH